MEGVLDVHAGNRSAQCILLLLALLEAALRTPQEVEVRVARGARGAPAYAASCTGRSIRAVQAIEGSIAVGLVAVGNVQLIADELPADHELVLAPNQSHVIGEGERVVIEVRDRISAAADRKPVALPRGSDRQLQTIE